MITALAIERLGLRRQLDRRGDLAERAARLGEHGQRLLFAGAIVSLARGGQSALGIAARGLETTRLAGDEAGVDQRLDDVAVHGVRAAADLLIERDRLVVQVHRLVEVAELADGIAAVVARVRRQGQVAAGARVVLDLA